MGVDWVSGQVAWEPPCGISQGTAVTALDLDMPWILSSRHRTCRLVPHARKGNTESRDSVPQWFEGGSGD